LLLITQKVDADDAVLGFMHGWLRHFTKVFESIVVICLEKGRADLPENIQVFPLGKDKSADYRVLRGGLSPLRLKLRRGRARMKYVKRFIFFVWRKRQSYDAVLVHMNPEYMILGGALWRFFRKSSALWYNHSSGGLMLRLAAFFSGKVFYTSPFSASAGFKKSVRMPAGIDTDLFAPIGAPPPRSILYLGRIAPVKQVHTLLQAARLLDRAGVDFSLSIVGDALARDAEYDARVKREGEELRRAGKLVFKKAVPNTETPALYSAHEVFVNLSPSGLFDKTVLEAFASGRLVVASSEAFGEILPGECRFLEGDAECLAAA
jgi:glycosyltransferase involved in cell wall biosynthesis